MPSSPAAVTAARTASAPRLCPAVRGRPRCFAQRPLPSMMMATCAGVREPAPACSRASGRRSDIHDIFFFGSQRFIDLLDVLVRQVLHLGLALAVLVLGDLVLLLAGLEGLHAVAPDVADRDARLLGITVGDLG